MIALPASIWRAFDAAGTAAMIVLHAAGPVALLVVSDSLQANLFCLATLLLFTFVWLLIMVLWHVWSLRGEDLWPVAAGGRASMAPYFVRLSRAVRASSIACITAVGASAIVALVSPTAKLAVVAVLAYTNCLAVFLLRHLWRTRNP